MPRGTSRHTGVLTPPRPAPRVLLYYPIHDLWAEYLPVAQPLKLQSQSPRAQRIVNSFMQLGQLLQRSQIPFTLIDHEHLAAAKVRPDGKLAIHDQRYTAVILPEGTELPPPAADIAERFRSRGGRVVLDAPVPGKQSGPSVIEQLERPCRISPASERVVLGQFLRDGRRILLLANVSREPYSGHVVTGGVSGTWQAMDPATGKIQPSEPDRAGRLRLELAARQAVLLVHSGSIAELGAVYFGISKHPTLPVSLVMFGK